MTILMMAKDETVAEEGEGIASFGDAKLVQDFDGNFQIVGGTPSEQRSARQWAAKFLDVKIP